MVSRIDGSIAAQLRATPTVLPSCPPITPSGRPESLQPQWLLSELHLPMCTAAVPADVPLLRVAEWFRAGKHSLVGHHRLAHWQYCPPREAGVPAVLIEVSWRQFCHEPSHSKRGSSTMDGSRQCVASTSPGRRPTGGIRQRPAKLHASCTGAY